MSLDAVDAATGQSERIEEYLVVDLTYLQTSASRMALLLLGTVNPRRLAAGALAARGLALSAGHCWDAGGCAGWLWCKKR